MRILIGKNVWLNDEELFCLDGKCRPEIQIEVDRAKIRLSAIASLPDEDPKIVGTMADIKRAAIEFGYLSMYGNRMHVCGSCHKTGGYQKYSRSGRWHKKGESNTNKPFMLSGVTFKPLCLSICSECVAIIKPKLPELLKDVKAEIGQDILGKDPLWKRIMLRECTQCQWKSDDKDILDGLRNRRSGSCPGCGSGYASYKETGLRERGFVLLPTVTDALV